MEYYGPTIKYIKLYYYDTFDYFVGIPLIKSGITNSYTIREDFSEIYGVNRLDCHTFPITYQIIDK